jgi:hypothetical protein
VSCHGVDEYKRTFRPNVAREELLEEVGIWSANEEYEKNHGSGVTEEDRCAYIEQWGTVQYKEWFARGTDCKTIVKNPKFLEAQKKFLRKPIADIEGGIRMSRLVEDPFRNNIRDINGNDIPEPPSEPSGDYVDSVYEVYIKNHGILNYMLKVNSNRRLEHLLQYNDIAYLQRSYIRKLEYEDKIESNV